MKTVSALRFPAALAAALALSVSALADQPAPYVGLGGGGNFLSDSDIDGTGIATEADYDPSYAIAPSVGYRFGNGIRVELEGAYRDNDVDSIAGVAGGTGEVSAASLMMNLLYDFDLGGVWKPYLGLGLGGARVDADSVRPIGGGVIDDDDNVLAYQGIAGIAYQVSEAVQLFADYRYFATEDPTWRTATGVSVDGEYSAHTALVGFRVFFGVAKPAPKAAPAAAPPAPPLAPRQAAAPPPPASAPPPDVARTYLVFFDWDRADLTAEALGIVRTAADNAGIAQVVRIELTGHADRSGPDRYNLGLSKRRAEAVMAELMRLGIPREEIAVAWKGEREPLVPTPDGVREPQNRRVEILFR